MARIFITGSADGLGQLAARRLVALGHEVVLHGRNRDRAQQALRAVPGARTALEGDLASIEATRALARQANEAGPFQAVFPTDSAMLSQKSDDQGAANHGSRHG